MSALFHRTPAASSPASGGDFAYLPDGAHYFDSACQTLRSQRVIDAELAYYHGYNACGGRVKYRWGQRVDQEVTDARTALLAFTGKSSKDYCVVFTLNTTYGINLILQQLKPEGLRRIVTSDIEHNSVFLPSMTYAKRYGIERVVLSRADDGSVTYQPDQLNNAIVLLNTTSNIDGRTLVNLPDLARDVRRGGGVLLLDAAQTFGHGVEALHGIDFDAAFGSGHKMYGPSIGFVILKRSLLDRLDPFFIGGGTVQDVDRDSFTLLPATDEPFARLEPGLQNWAGIIGLAAAAHWLESYRPHGKTALEYERQLAEQLFAGVRRINGITVINHAPSSTISFFAEGVDAHRMALYFDEAGIMCRSGAFCCHYFLTHLKKLPPLVRLSIGLHNTPEQIDHVLATLRKILTAVS